MQFCETKPQSDWYFQVHGRTKEQRYTKLADWEYIEQCAKLASPVPLIGNGDILSFVDYDLARVLKYFITQIKIP